MTDDLAPAIPVHRGIGALSLADGITLTPTGAVIDADVTFEQFCTGLQICQELANGAMWALGDLLHYGDQRGDWGEMYTQALEVTQKSYSTLTKAAWVSRTYPPDQRVHSVSWSHHREAISEKDPVARHALLLRASVEGLSREAVRELAIGERPPTPPSHTCPQCGHQW